MPPAGQDGVVLAIIARVLNHRDRNPGSAHQLGAERESAIAAAIIDQDDLVAPVDHRASMSLITARRVSALL